MEFRSLKDIDFDTLYNAFSRAFADYAVSFGRDEVSSIFKRRGFCPELSFAAFDNNEIVAFTFNGIGSINGKRTAYDTGTGTLPGYRGMGLAQKIFSHSIPFLKNAGVSQYLLEVLKNNAPAISVYRNLGFRVSREFGCYRQKKEDLISRLNHTLPEGIRILPADADAVKMAYGFGDFEPAWQNTPESLRRSGTDLRSLGAYYNDTLVGCCIFDPVYGDLALLAVDSRYRRRGIATSLLGEAVRQIDADCVKMLNIPTTDTSLPLFLHSAGIPEASGQYEMLLSL